MAQISRGEADSVLQRALDLPESERRTFVDRTCAGHPELRSLVLRLLRSCDPAQPALEPGGGAAGPLWDALAREHGDTRSLECGDRLGPWRVVGTLGRGGMATVYRAERADVPFEQTVALKVLDVAGSHDGLAARFDQERRILATLRHPNIAGLVDGGVDDAGRAYVAMEYVDGVPIDDFCDRHRLDVMQRLRLFERVAQAVQHAHDHLVVHRDLKPSNILVTRDGTPKLLDFGIAKLLDGPGLQLAPVTRSVLHPMTPEYASPEQIRGEPLTTASDVFQLGSLLYRLLTGGTPWDVQRHDLAQLVQAVCSTDPRPPSIAASDASEAVAAARATTPERLRRALEGDLDNILLKALRTEREHRYGSVSRLQDDLQRHREGRTVSARPATLWYRVSRFAGRNRVAVAAATVVVASLVAGLAAAGWQARIAASEARRAAEVRDFVVGLFEGVGPDVTGGREVTAGELLDRGARELAARLSGEPRLQAEMLGVVGRMYSQLGKYREARVLLERARATWLALPGRDRNRDDLAATNAADLAGVLRALGELDAAERLAREAVAVRRSRDEPDALAASLALLGSIQAELARPDEAEAAFDEALAIDRRGADPAQLAAHLGAYAAALLIAERYPQALSAGEQALAIHRELHGSMHTSIATDLLHLGGVLREQGDYTAAERRTLEALEMRTTLLGEEHPSVAAVHHELGEVRRAAGRLEEAEKTHRLALAIRRAALGNGHPDVANSLNSIAIVLYYRAQHAEAATMFEQVVPVFRSAYGERHPHVLSVLNNAGAARREAQDYAGAERVLREVLTLRREVFGEPHRMVAQSLNNLALVLAKQGVDAEAEALFRQALAMWRQTMGEGHPDVGDGAWALGQFLLERGRHRDAEGLLGEALAIKSRSLDPEAPLLASVRLYLGECLVQTDRRAEARALLGAALPVLSREFGDTSPIVRRAEQALRAAQAE